MSSGGSTGGDPPELALPGPYGPQETVTRPPPGLSTIRSGGAAVSEGERAEYSPVQGETASATTGAQRGARPRSLAAETLPEVMAYRKTRPKMPVYADGMEAG